MKNLRKPKKNEPKRSEEYYRAKEADLGIKIAELPKPIEIQEKRLKAYEILDDIGVEVAKSVSSFFDLKSGTHFLNRLKEIGIDPGSDNLRTSKEISSLTGRTFVLTGTLPSLKREEATKLILNAGGHVSGSVSKATDYLVAGEDAGSKLSKAREMKIQILDENGLRRLLNKESMNPSKNKESENDQGLLF